MPEPADSTDYLEVLTDRLESLPEVRAAVVFGSRGRGEARRDSDIDLGVLLEPTANSLLTRGRIAATLSDLPSVDVVDLDQAPALLAHRALRDGRLLFCRDRPRWVRFVMRTLSRSGDEAYYRRILSEGARDRLAEGRFGRP